MSTKFLSVVALFATSFLSAQSGLIRAPKISPDASQIAFSYQGDIWTYHINNQQTKRLTLHQAYESSPVWSANGTELAFASNRKGATNIFTVSKNGGIPRQLTFYPITDIPSGWTKNNNIIFTTNRTFKGPEWDAQTYKVSANGGTPSRLITAYGSMATVSPNGNFVAFVKGACRIAREDYTGSAQRDIWIFNTKTKKYHQITDTPKMIILHFGMLLGIYIL